MKPTVKLGEATTPEGAVLTLLEHDGNYFLMADGAQLMTSFAHGSEVELARLGCAPFRGVRQPHVLIGGLGLGFTLAAACAALPQKRARFEVAELIPEIVAWNREHLRDLHPGLWDDPRVAVREGDVGDLLRDSKGEYHVILLDTDNGPEAFTGAANDSLYTMGGLRTAHAALKEGGLLAVWSALDDKSFERRLHKAGFDVARESVPAAHKGKRKRRHTIWLARKGR
ncbi:MAG: hypothetical protein HKO57_11325, partial [Akkermansiaceae bacterium]|nr:hypothetical protein [Akkermansiaceae bacterium]